MSARWTFDNESKKWVNLREKQKLSDWVPTKTHNGNVWANLKTGEITHDNPKNWVHFKAKGVKKTRGRKTRGRKTRGRKSRGRKTRGRKTRGRKTRGRKSRRR